MWNMCLNFECISAECFEQSLRTLFKVWACTKGAEECIYTGLSFPNSLFVSFFFSQWDFCTKYLSQPQMQIVLSSFSIFHLQYITFFYHYVHWFSNDLQLSLLIVQLLSPIGYSWVSLKIACVPSILGCCSMKPLLILDHFNNQPYSPTNSCFFESPVISPLILYLTSNLT